MYNRSLLPPVDTLRNLLLALECLLVHVSRFIAQCNMIAPSLRI